MKLDVLSQQIAAICEPLEGKVGICAIQSQLNFQFDYDADHKFFMASTYKVPIACYCLHLVDQGQLHLAKLITLKSNQLSSGSGILHKHFEIPGVSLSLYNLLRLMLEISDNSATDAIIELCGGPSAITHYLRSLKIFDIDIDRTTKAAFADLVSPNPKDTQDRTTPVAMAQLLLKIKNEQILKPATTHLLLNIMQHCQTGHHRIPALLPPTLKIAQKTGSTSIVTNDIGIIELPNQSGELILTIYIQSHSALAKREMAIALIAKTLYDYVVFQMEGENNERAGN